MRHAAWRATKGQVSSQARAGDRPEVMKTCNKARQCTRCECGGSRFLGVKHSGEELGGSKSTAERKPQALLLCRQFCPSTPDNMQSCFTRDAQKSRVGRRTDPNSEWTLNLTFADLLRFRAGCVTSARRKQAQAATVYCNGEVHVKGRFVRQLLRMRTRRASISTLSRESTGNK